MKLELKALKIHEGMSEETTCYEADLYVDGKKACRVSNRGHGGCDDQRWLPGAPQEAVEDHFKALPRYREDLGDGQFLDVQPDLESWCGDQIIENRSLKDYKRAVKKAVVVGLAETEMTFKAAPPASPALRAHIAAKYPEGTILNDLDEAGLRAYIRAAIERGRSPVPNA